MKFLYTIINDAMEYKGRFEFQIIFNKVDKLLTEKFSNDQFLYTINLRNGRVTESSLSNISINSQNNTSKVEINWHPKSFVREIDIDGQPYWISPKYSMELTHIDSTTADFVHSFKNSFKRKMSLIKSKDDDVESCLEHCEEVEY